MPKSATAAAVKLTVSRPRVAKLLSSPLSTGADGKTCKPARPTLLWIDDFEPGLAMYKAMFENLGFKVLTASTGEQGVNLAASNRVDIVVTDYEMPVMDGAAVTVAIKSMNSRIPVILFSGSTLMPERAGALADACCDKAGSRQQLLAAIHRLLHKKRGHALQPLPVTRASEHGHRTVA